MDVGMRTRWLSSLSTPPMHTLILGPTKRQVLVALSAPHRVLAWSPPRNGLSPCGIKEECALLCLPTLCCRTSHFESQPHSQGLSVGQSRGRETLCLAPPPRREQERRPTCFLKAKQSKNWELALRHCSQDMGFSICRMGVTLGTFWGNPGRK